MRNQNRMTDRIGLRQITKYLLSTAAVGLALSASANAQPATETVVVTGTSIRGAQPVGSNLITLDRAAIENTGSQTVQQLLTNIPGVSNFGGEPQGTQGVPAALGIHGIGQGSSTATLVLIDGHRFPGQGVAESDPDPNLIPTIALQTVEVLPDGASAIYGSDAVSGVINFITRKDFNGVEASAQTGVADSYNTFDASGVFGHAWSGGSLLMAYEYSSQSNLMNAKRDFMTPRQDIRRGAASPTLFTGITANPPNSNGTDSVLSPANGTTVIAPMTVTPAAGPGTTGPYGVAIPFPSTGANFQTFNCPVATIAQTNSSAAFYYQPNGGYGGPAYYTTNASNTLPNQGACDNFRYSTALPAVTTSSSMVQLRQEITDKLSFDMELVYGSHISSDRNSRGTIGPVAVFGPGNLNAAGTALVAGAPAPSIGQVNPFYVGNATTGTQQEFIRYDFNALLGPGAGNKTGTTNLFITAGLTWDLGNDRELVLNGTAGANGIVSHTFGGVSAAEAMFALNGTSNNTGSIAASAPAGQDVFGLGTAYPGTRVLNTLNALDVWHPAGPTNLTSPQVIASLKDGGTVTQAYQGMQDVSLKFDGPVTDLPAGPVKIAVGAEFMHGYFDEYGTRSLTSGPSLSNSAAYYYRNGRQVYSAFAEISIPVVSAEMNVPLIESLTVDMSGRYDKYSDFGDTENPKVGIDWLIVDGLKARVSYGTSFVAPNLHDKNAFNSQSNIQGSGNTQLTNPLIPFGDTRGFNGGAGLAGTWVSTPDSCIKGSGVVQNSAGTTLTPTVVGGVNTFPGATPFGCKVSFATTSTSTSSATLVIPGGNGNLHAATGRNYSAGIDLDFGKFTSFLEGLQANITYYDFYYQGVITNQQTQDNLPKTVTFAPIGGWTPTSAYIQAFIAGRSVTTALQPLTWITYDNRLQNAYNEWQNGIDFAVNYLYRSDDMGTFRFGLSGSQVLRQSQQGGPGAPLADIIDGKNSPRFLVAELQTRSHLGWSMGALSTDLGVNYTHPINLRGITQYPYFLPGPGRGFNQGFEGATTFTSGTTGHLGALITVDLNLNYTLGAGEWGLPEMVTDGTSVSLKISNLFDTDPPFNPTTQNGYTTGNELGRTFTFGLRKKF